MDTKELKAHITELLVTVEDERFLQSINAMLQAYVGEITLTPEEKTAVDAGIEEAKTGRTLSNEQVFQNMKQRYSDLKPIFVRAMG